MESAVTMATWYCTPSTSVVYSVLYFGRLRLTYQCVCPSFPTQTAPFHFSDTRFKCTKEQSIYSHDLTVTWPVTTPPLCPSLRIFERTRNPFGHLCGGRVSCSPSAHLPHMPHHLLLLPTSAAPQDLRHWQRQGSHWRPAAVQEAAFVA